MLIHMYGGGESPFLSLSLKQNNMSDLLQRQVIARETKQSILGGSTIDFLSPCSTSKGKTSTTKRKVRHVRKSAVPRWMSSEVFSQKKQQPQKIKTRKTTLHTQADSYANFERPEWMRSGRGSLTLVEKNETDDAKPSVVEKSRKPNLILERLRNEKDEAQYLSLNLSVKKRDAQQRVSNEDEAKIFEHSKRTNIEPVTLNQLKNDWNDRLREKGLLAETREQRLIRLRESKTKLTSKVGTRTRRKHKSSELKKMYKHSVTKSDFLNRTYQTQTSKDYLHPRNSNWHYERKSKHGRISGDSTKYASSMSRAVDIGKIY